MKYIKVFENTDSDELKDKRLLDRLTMLYATGNSELADCDFREGTSSKESDFYLTSNFGEVGFEYDGNFEVTEYTGMGDYDVTIVYTRKIGNIEYSVIVLGVLNTWF